jgi:hypothetical protein
MMSFDVKDDAELTLQSRIGVLAWNKDHTARRPCRQKAEARKLLNVCSCETTRQQALIGRQQTAFCAGGAQCNTRHASVSSLEERDALPTGKVAQRTC